MIRSNPGPISYYFWDKRRFRSKIAKFSHSRVFNASAEGIPLEFCDGGNADNYGHATTRWWKVWRHACSFRYIIHNVTDRQMDVLKQYRALYAEHSDGQQTAKSALRLHALLQLSKSLIKFRRRVRMNLNSSEFSFSALTLTARRQEGLIKYLVPYRWHRLQGVGGSARPVPKISSGRHLYGCPPLEKKFCLLCPGVQRALWYIGVIAVSPPVPEILNWSLGLLSNWETVRSVEPPPLSLSLSPYPTHSTPEAPRYSCTSGLDNPIDRCHCRLPLSSFPHRPGDRIIVWRRRAPSETETHLTALYSRGSTLSCVLSDMSSRLICDAIRFVTDTFISWLWPTSSTCRRHTHSTARTTHVAPPSSPLYVPLNDHTHLVAIFQDSMDKPVPERLHSGLCCS